MTWRSRSPRRSRTRSLMWVCRSAADRRCTPFRGCADSPRGPDDRGLNAARAHVHMNGRAPRRAGLLFPRGIWTSAMVGGAFDGRDATPCALKAAFIDHAGRTYSEPREDRAL